MNICFGNLQHCFVGLQITVDGEVIRDSNTILRVGSQLVYHRLPWREPDAPYLLEVLYEDDDMGLVHYQYNADVQNPALAISAFGSASAGTVSVPPTLFTTNIDDNVLALSLKTDVATVQKLKAGLALKP
ncbi:germin-like protein 8-11 [Rosa chinensis]|uniref:germin-like protein 8-11 n=1 Tax=Rosa chinensis TaxID=74649 RepID=UPI000D0910AF|nr:germin-like protein 8-11 [Rosa chinensis]